MLGVSRERAPARKRGRTASEPSRAGELYTVTCGVRVAGTGRDGALRCGSGTERVSWPLFCWIGRALVVERPSGDSALDADAADVHGVSRTGRTRGTPHDASRAPELHAVPRAVRRARSARGGRRVVAVKRREFLRDLGGLRRPGPPVDAPRAEPGTDRPLPAVIAWLDPEMKPTPRRGLGVDEPPLPLLRPPGAVAEREFLEACTQCGDCQAACPHDAIRPAPARMRGATGTPMIDPLVQPCLLCDTWPCIEACGTGALESQALAPLGTARIQPLDCLNRLGSPCRRCLEVCPIPDALAISADHTPRVEESLCTGCGICQASCPAPGAAILLLPNPNRPSLPRPTREPT